jgi:hypothetical protein
MHRDSAEQLRQQGVLDEPVCIPRRPVRILPVDDLEDDVVGLRRIV